MIISLRTVGALRKYACGIFLVSDHSGYAARTHHSSNKSKIPKYLNTWRFVDK
ncbi:MAG: hypothetical protein LIO62_02870 [Clostridiales bacterium]|nr:hypothetical protein [Clostridiales bacterium]